jgi:ribosomal protein L34E
VIQETRLKKRLEIRKEQMETGEHLMLKLRNDVAAGFVPTDKKQFADILKMVTDYAKRVGHYEECKDILEKLSEEKPMGMEKVGVECNGNHAPTNTYMEKKASGEVQCRHCGARFGDLNIADKASMSEQTKQAKTEAKGAVEQMLGG